MTELSVLERVRAAVAEAGYDPTLIVMSLHPARPNTFSWNAGTLPRRVVWRAREAVEHGRPRCHQCWQEKLNGDRVVGCLADRRFVEDCGRDRGEP